MPTWYIYPLDTERQCSAPAAMVLWRNIICQNRNDEDDDEDDDDNDAYSNVTEME